jgi:hypothetical protein
MDNVVGFSQRYILDHARTSTTRPRGAHKYMRILSNARSITLLVTLLLVAMMAVPALSFASQSALVVASAQAPTAGQASLAAVASGGLPTTATPWYTVLVAGLVLTLLGTVGFWTTLRELNA